MRDVIFKVVYVNLADMMVTLYEDKDFAAAEHFAKNYDGGEKEVFIKKVYRLSSTRTTGAEL